MHHNLEKKNTQQKNEKREILLFFWVSPEKKKGRRGKQELRRIQKRDITEELPKNEAREK